MSATLTSIRNIGPAMADALRAAGIRTAEELRDLGPDKAYAAMIDAGTRPHFIGYYAMVMGLQGRPWNDCQGPEKDNLRKRFDAIVAAKTSRRPGNALARALDEVGLMLGETDDPARQNSTSSSSKSSST